MASSTRHLCRSLFQVTRQIPVKRKCRQPQFSPCRQPARSFSISATWRANESSPTTQSQPTQSASQSEDADDEIEPSEYMTPKVLITASDLDPEVRADFDILSKEGQADYLALQNHYKAVLESGADDEALESLARKVVSDAHREGQGLDIQTSRALGKDVGFWALDEDDEFGQMEDADDEVSPDLITSVAESELEVHREVREYTRVAAWDMPLLRKFAKPFKLPDHTTPLRFRYTTYMGEFHPAAKKVVVEFCTKELPGLTEQQRIKLIKLVGVRYNPDTDVVKMSCEKFEAPAQNKRYLGDLINKLVTESKTGDTFEDVPLDFRHHKSKTRPEFPEEWKLTSKTVQALLEKREQGKLLLPEGESPTDGRKAVNEYVMLRGVPPGPTPQPTLRRR